MALYKIGYSYFIADFHYTEVHIIQVTLHLCYIRVGRPLSNVLQSLALYFLHIDIIYLSIF